MILSGDILKSSLFYTLTLFWEDSIKGDKKRVGDTKLEIVAIIQAKNNGSVDKEKWTNRRSSLK